MIFYIHNKLFFSVNINEFFDMPEDKIVGMEIKCIVGDIVRCRKNKNRLTEIIPKKCVFNAVWYVRKCL